ncbi:hypothetical protein RFI_36257, partial [Reticulomyxa filosa]
MCYCSDSTTDVRKIIFSFFFLHLALFKQIIIKNRTQIPTFEYFKMESSDNKSEQTQIMDTPTPFVTLASLPVLLSRSQCIVYNHEILICGGWENKTCYSYHTIKDQYKAICSYPVDIELDGHCVLRLTNNSNPNGITLLSLGGQFKHTLIMKYVSVWDNPENSENEDKSKETMDVNKWTALTDKYNKSICIGRKKDNYKGLRAVIGGINSHLLFLTYLPENIDVFNLHTFQYVNHSTLPIGNNMSFHSERARSNANQNKDAMLLFSGKTGLSIEYDKRNNTFQYTNLR